MASVSVLKIILLVGPMAIIASAIPAPIPGDNPAANSPVTTGNAPASDPKQDQLDYHPYCHSGSVFYTDCLFRYDTWCDADGEISSSSWNCKWYCFCTQNCTSNCYGPKDDNEAVEAEGKRSEDTGRE